LGGHYADQTIFLLLLCVERLLFHVACSFVVDASVPPQAVAALPSRLQLRRFPIDRDHAQLREGSFQLVIILAIDRGQDL
jgi:hypothetical protein